MLIQQHVNGSDAFRRSWAEYKVGFNDSSGNYWLGNDLLSQLTENDRYKLRLDLQFLNGSWHWVEYSSLIVLNETTNYTLLVSGYSGNAADALSYSHEMMFSTYDRDNDRYPANCAANSGGGFWYKSCARAIVNAAPESFRWWSSLSTYDYLQSSRMWLTC